MHAKYLYWWTVGDIFGQGWNVVKSFKMVQACSKGPKYIYQQSVRSQLDLVVGGEDTEREEAIRELH